NIRRGIIKNIGGIARPAALKERRSRSCVYQFALERRRRASAYQIRKGDRECSGKVCSDRAFTVLTKEESADPAFEIWRPRKTYTRSPVIPIRFGYPKLDHSRNISIRRFCLKLFNLIDALVIVTNAQIQ